MTPSGARQILQPGTLLANRYHIERLLGDDQAGRRYLALDTQEAARPLALQELPVPRFRAGDARAEAAAWLERQIDRLQRIAHPGLCAVRGVHIPAALDAPFYVIGDHLPGLTLAEELEEADGVISWRQALDWTISLCDTLEYLHGQSPPYVHGALRPGQIVLDARGGRPVLVGYRLACMLDPTRGEQWGYVPFEQYIGRAEPRSDLYALGALLYTLIGDYDPDLEFGRLRRAGVDVQGALRQLFPRLDAAQAAVPPPLPTALARATAFIAADRFPDAAAMGAALRAVRGPVVELEAPVTRRDAEEPAWTRLGLTEQEWFALPLPERNRRLLGLVQPPPPEP